MKRVFDRTALVAVLALAALVRFTGCEPSAASSHDDSEHPRCVACHMAEYQSAPRHVNQRPTECHVCHTQNAWHPAVQAHRWPLTGAHARLACTQCHADSPPVYAGTSTACVACHLADFQFHTFPAHQRFPTTCADCHTTIAWRPAREPEAPALPVASQPTADAAPPGDASVITAATTTTRTPATNASRPRHGTTSGSTAPAPTSEPNPPPVVARVHPEQVFPIASGHHAGIGCTTCHDQGGAMSRGNTDCVQCHPRSRYDDIHSFVRGYPQTAAAPNFCVQCHRRGTRARQ